LKLIEEFPQAVKEKDGYGCYPLHYAGEKNHSERVVLKLIDEFSHAINEMDDFGSYPLHYACRFHKSDTVVLKLIKGYPQAVQVKNYSGSYPLHYACGGKQSEKVVLKLIDRFPQAARETDNFKNYPLIYACRKKNRSDNVILRLLNEYPYAAKEWEHYCDHSDYPLHLACRINLSERVVLALTNLNLLAVKYENINSGLNPLSIARLYGQSATTIQVLEVLTSMSDAERRTNIPKIVTLHGLDNLRRIDIFHWVQDKSPILVDGQTIFNNDC
jgi:ankyrin repeat protein